MPNLLHGFKQFPPTLRIGISCRQIIPVAAVGIGRATGPFAVVPPLVQFTFAAVVARCQLYQLLPGDMRRLDMAPARWSVA